ncbi:hypothetical protein BDD43_0774 [Mucilaginibacter gracilis]|uniref:PH domain-containing protein n=1 Tax=Mucilaginibacter gracilis TaxID=423350 RepID=A0A495IX68_9SPHI|nr:hypothetical protein [Mucilaginibacter gracilis]RKR80648.1 hypothetical protein BDD43_0774 [Mucilaginibacter gracilis]
MPLLNVKVQHKNYEKGEFCDEQPRSLDETIQLINTFPWDAERTLTVVQLTGPSVTIRNEQANYLKTGLYFNGKYCLYYLDGRNHLYEYHAADLATVNKLVTDFFNAVLDVSVFEKHFVNIGNKAHFETASFEYRQSLWRVLMLTSSLLLFGLLFFMGNAAMLFGHTPAPFVFMFSIVFAIYCWLLFGIYYNAYVNRHNYLHISRGNNVFYFGQNTDTINAYNKTDIKEIVSYEGRGQGNFNVGGSFEVFFNNGETIKITNMLINNLDFRGKFLDSMDNPTIRFMPGRKSLFNMK